MKLMPNSSASFGLEKVLTSSSMVMVPPEAGNSPVNTFISVDFPAPFSPIKAWTSPDLNVRLIVFKHLIGTE
jgi:hypothetical protein